MQGKKTQLRKTRMKPHTAPQIRAGGYFTPISVVARGVRASVAAW